MSKLFCFGWLVTGMMFLAGCGGGDADPNLIPVTGVITINDDPAGKTEVAYYPEGDTKGNGGKGATDSTGKYEIMTPQGKKGLVAGKYKVTVSRRLNPDGSPPAPNEMPIESQARETLPPKYSDPTKTELSITLAAGDKRSFDFSLKTAKK